MNDIISKMTNIGLSEYESKVYLRLLRGSPATAYETAKASGVPTSKIYEVLKKLVDKGIVSLYQEGKTKRYLPIEPEEFLGNHKKVTNGIIDSLMSDLLYIKERERISPIWTYLDYAHLVHKAETLIAGAKRTLLLSIWGDEFAQFHGLLREAESRGVRIAAVHFGQPRIKVGQVYPHPVEESMYEQKSGRGLVIVSDSREVVTGTMFKFSKAEGAWTSNTSVVTLAEDYIKHDIYIMKIMRRYDRLLKTRFGNSYGKLRDVFTDEEMPLRFQAHR
jgi:sugar-specific transcriptional regulator TrmB